MAISPIQENVAAPLPPAEEAGRSPLLKVRALRVIRGVAQLVIGGGALAYVIAKSDTRGLLEAIKATRTSYLPLAVVTTLAVYWLMALRWQVILGTRGYRVGIPRLFTYYLISVFFNNFVPGGNVSGDVVRFIYVNRTVKDKAFVLSTLVYEKLIGLFAVLLFVLVATAASGVYFKNGLSVYVGEAAVALIFLVLASLMSNYLSSRLVRFIKLLAARLGAERIGAAAGRVLEAISSLTTHKGMLVRTVAITLVVRAVWSLGFFVVARAMSLPLGLPLVFAFVSLVDLVRMLPITPNGLGLREGALILLLDSVGVAREQALMFSLLGFAPLLLAAVSGGIIYISRTRWGREGKPGPD